LKSITSSFHLQTNLQVQDDGGRAGEPGSKWHMNSNMYFALLCVVCEHVLQILKVWEVISRRIIGTCKFFIV